MANAYLIDAAKDAELSYIRTNSTQLFIVSALCATYAEASSTYKLGVKASPTIGAPEDDTTVGRKIVVSAITDGTVSASGTASHLALCSADTLITSQPLSAPVPVTSGSTFTLTAQAIKQPDPA